VLYEMLTATPMFETSETISDAVAAILTREPDWTKLPAATPIAIRTVLRHCLEKDRKRRLADIADARLEIDEARNEPAPVVSPSTLPAHSRRREFLWATAALVFFVTTAALALRTLFTAAPEPAMVRFDVAAPQGARIDRTSTALAPNGRRVTFVATFESKALLWVRPLDASSAQPIPGTEDASRPFWSPDGQHIAFFAQGKIKRVAATGGPVQVLCSLPSTSTYNGTWNDGGVILFAPNDQGPVLRVPAAGGQPTPATELNASLKETRHSYPNFLPDGRHFLYLVTGEASRGTYIGTLDSNERHAIPGIVSEAKYSSTGYLMFLRDASLMAQRFDINRLELSGEAVQIADQLGNGPLAPFSASMNGAISYVAGSVPNSSLVWFDRAGKPLTVVGPSGEYRNLELSPDDRFVAFERGSPADVWVLDLQRGLTSRFTSNAGVDSCPVWSPDGRTIAFTTDRDGLGNIYERTFGVVGEDKLLLKTEGMKTAMDWSHDGRYLAYGLGLDIWAVPMSGDRQPIRITETPFTEREATLSPDGRWIAYASTESGRFEVYIQSFPKPGIKQQVSTTGGIAPRWKRDGTELLYLAADGKLMAASANPRGSSLELNTPSPLFQTSLTFATSVDARIRAQYDVSIDGRFLMSVTPAEAFTHINVILNWSAGQRR
jgi:Tol biopolymer transport system component